MGHVIKYMICGLTVVGLGATAVWAQSPEEKQAKDRAKALEIVRDAADSFAWPPDAKSPGWLPISVGGAKIVRPAPDAPEHLDVITPSPGSTRIRIAPAPPKNLSFACPDGTVCTATVTSYFQPTTTSLLGGTAVGGFWAVKIEKPKKCKVTASQRIGTVFKIRTHRQKFDEDGNATGEFEDPFETCFAKDADKKGWKIPTHDKGNFGRVGWTADMNAARTPENRPAEDGPHYWFDMPSNNGTEAKGEKKAGGIAGDGVQYVGQLTLIVDITCDCEGGGIAQGGAATTFSWTNSHHSTADGSLPLSGGVLQEVGVEITKTDPINPHPDTDKNPNADVKKSDENSKHQGKYLEDVKAADQKHFKTPVESDTGRPKPKKQD